MKITKKRIIKLVEKYYNCKFIDEWKDDTVDEFYDNYLDFEVTEDHNIIVQLLDYDMGSGDVYYKHKIYEHYDDKKCIGDIKELIFKDEMEYIINGKD